MTWEQALNHINSVSRYQSRPGVECMRALLDKLGHPEKNLRIIHIAGTNGKGSTCMYLAGILRELGFNTGIFTSPHLIRENERIRIDEDEISNEDFLSCFERVHEAELALLKDGFGQISYFDFFTGTALVYFARKKPDFVILETGLGGRLDSTNAVEKPLLTIITSIGLDHVFLLGSTVSEIAKEKCGIIKPSAPVVYIAKESYSKVIEECAKENKILAYGVEKGQCEILENTVKHIDFSLNNIYYRDNVFRINTPALYQAVNASLAMTAAAVLRTNKDTKGLFGAVDDTAWNRHVRDGLAKTQWAGRMELIEPGIYIDGAHNADGIAAFLETAGSMKKTSEKPYVLLFSAVNDKSYGLMIEKICRSGIFDAFVVTQIEGTRCLPADDIMREFKQYTNRPVTAVYDIKEAVEAGRMACGRDTQLFCAGSLYLAGEVRKAGLHL